MDDHNLKASISALLAIIGFIFLPWLGTAFTSAGSIIFTDTLYNSVGALQDRNIWVVVAAVSAGLLAGLWGMFRPRQGEITATLACACGLAGLAYFAANASAQSDLSTRGLGYWVTLVGCAGLVIQRVPDMRLNLAANAQGLIRRVFPALPRKRSLTPYYFLLPGLVLYAIWIIGPTAYTSYMSLLQWDFISPPVYVGFANYMRLFKDPNFLQALVNNLRWLIIFITVPTALGLFLAMLLNRETFGGRFFKVSFYFPLVLSLPVIGLVWAWVFNPAMGLINPILASLGMQDLPGWLGDRKLAIWVIIIAATWRQVGYVMILYLAGLKSIDPEVLSAAQIDGANRWQLFRHVIFPLLAPVTTIVVIIQVIDSVRAFDLVSIMTRGGQDTQVLANLMYMETFNNYQMGYGAAIAVILFLISGVFIFTYLYRMVRLEARA